ncbi:hypothetical protein WAX86_18960 [Photobacterium damselae subsp. damselae]|uniref:hypothetical protein n=1 Tax=Photobacterium damselae TaxID=38293 RepID=UPI00311AFC30
MNKINIFILVNIISISLFGCGGDSDSSSVSTIAEKPIIRDIFDNIEYKKDKIYHLDLAHAVTDPMGYQVYLKSISSSSDDCSIVSYDKNLLTVEVMSNGKVACNFDYKVSNRPNNQDISSTSQDGNYYLLISDLSDEIDLFAISLTTNVNSPPILIDLKKELGEKFPIGYKILDISYSGTGFIDDLDKESSTMLFSNSNAGMNRIYYSLTNGENVVPGFIDIAVSDIGIEQPEVDDFIYDDVVLLGEPKIISINGHFDDKGQKLMLTKVSAFNADVSIINEYEFKFMSDRPGIHYVTYYVTNELGGLSVGIVQINVGGAPFQDISLDIDGIDVTFIAPKEINSLTEHEKKLVIAKYKETGEYGPAGVIMPMFNTVNAHQICSGLRARIPTESDLKKLYDSFDNNLFQKYQWPITKKYITSEGFLFDFKTGEATYQPGIGYLTCFK